MFHTFLQVNERLIEAEEEAMVKTGKSLIKQKQNRTWLGSLTQLAANPGVVSLSPSQAT